MTNDIMIQVDHITKKFGKLKAVDDVSLTLKKGEIVCLIGPSGSGKSTVLRCIDHLEKPEAGSIYIDGALLKEGTPEYNKLRSKMGFVFQHFNLFPNMTVLENLTLAPLKVMGMTEEEANAVAIKYLQKVGLEDKKDTYPNKLSGGQKQRVAIARSLCLNPEVMLFDEPTSALDPISTSKIEDLLMDLKKDYTIVIVTHNMQQASRIADNTAFFLQGEIIETGDTEKIFSFPQDKRTEDYITGRFG